MSKLLAIIFIAALMAAATASAQNVKVFGGGGTASNFAAQ